MPYFVFHVRPVAQYDKRAECAVFAEASALAKSLRAGLPPGSGERIKLMFAPTEEEAVDLLRDRHLETVLAREAAGGRGGGDAFRDLVHRREDLLHRFAPADPFAR